jgi:hypothetical protein
MEQLKSKLQRLGCAVKSRHGCIIVRKGANSMQISADSDGAFMMGPIGSDMMPNDGTCNLSADDVISKLEDYNYLSQSIFCNNMP